MNKVGERPWMLQELQLLQAIKNTPESQNPPFNRQEKSQKMSVQTPVTPSPNSKAKKKRLAIGKVFLT